MNGNIFIDSRKLHFVVLDKSLMERLADDLVALIQDWKYVEWQKSNFMIDLSKKFEYSFALYYDTLLCGFCIASGNQHSFYYIHLFFIGSEFRKLGLGKVMLDRALNICIEKKLSGIKLRCPESNKRAHDFYLNYGFMELGLVHDEISGCEADYLLEYVVN